MLTEMLRDKNDQVSTLETIKMLSFLFAVITHDIAQFQKVAWDRYRETKHIH